MVVVAHHPIKVPTTPGLIRTPCKPDQMGGRDSSAISLCPLLGKAFGGSAGLIDVREGRDLRYQAVPPQGDRRVGELDVAAATSQPTPVTSDGQDHATTE